VLRLEAGEKARPDRLVPRVFPERSLERVATLDPSVAVRVKCGGQKKVCVRHVFPSGVEVLSGHLRARWDSGGRVADPSPGRFPVAYLGEEGRVAEPGPR